MRGSGSTPNGDEIDPQHDRAGRPAMASGDRDDGVDIGIDIGVGPSAIGGNRPTTRAKPAARSAQHARRSSWKRIGAVLGVVVAAALALSVFASDDRGDRTVDESVTESGEPPPQVADDEGQQPGVSTQASPTPTQVVIPVVSQGISRAGETCAIAPGGSGDTVVRFRVPDGLSTRCGATTTFWTDPPAIDTRPPLPLEIVVSDRDLNRWFVEFAAERLPDSLDWSPLEGRRAWRATWEPILNTNDEPEPVWHGLELVIAEVPGGSVAVSWTDDPALAVDRVDLAQSFDQLLDSIQIETPDDPFHELPWPGVSCTGDHWTTLVPWGWFAGERCRWLNTSSESPVVLQCDCLPPLWIEAGTIPLDGDFGFSEIDLDQFDTRSDGTPIRVIEGLRRDPNNFDRALRTVVVDLGTERVAVIAARAPEHTLPGHTWQDTLDAQQTLVNGLRAHSDPGCAPATRWLADNRSGQTPSPFGQPVIIEMAPAWNYAVPSGTALLATGCTRTQHPQIEVHVEAAPDLIGWVDDRNLRAPDPATCPSGERTFNRSEWVEAATGDFDGDGRSDTAYTRRPFDAGLTFADVPTLAVLFANGGLAEGHIASSSAQPGDDGDDTSIVFDATIVARRVLGMGRDLLEVRHPLDNGGIHIDFRDATTCWIDQGPGVTIDPARRDLAGSCVINVPWLRDVIRLWSLPAAERLTGTPLPSGSFELQARDGELVPVGQAGGPVACGPTIETPPELMAQDDLPGAELTGDHELSLQWISARGFGVGAIDFRPMSTPPNEPQRYLVEGSQTAPPGESLEIYGVIEVIGDDELAFDGLILSTIARLNGGETCVRDAGQRFVRRPGTDTYRMLDRINCDGARTDWIDITLVRAD